MSPARVLVACLLRCVAIVVVIAAYVAVVNRSESTDALGAGLLAFLILVAMALIWALVDGVRRGLVEALATWVLTSAVTAVGIPVALALTDSSRDVTTEVSDGFVFFVVVLLVPAVLGLAVGGLVHRVRRPAAAPVG
ncbi:hypothetical protein [Nocardioides sp.]|uniref:hypothetical protein n=1 Tax=Nocardioides sp. TaxID=35761 RepID=UPI0025E6EFF2|nr:hypothetical protein [Nocardioides sp.]